MTPLPRSGGLEASMDGPHPNYRQSHPASLRPRHVHHRKGEPCPASFIRLHSIWSLEGKLLSVNLRFQRDFYNCKAEPQTSGKAQGQSPFLLKSLLPIGPGLCSQPRKLPRSPLPVALDRSQGPNLGLQLLTLRSLGCLPANTTPPHTHTYPFLS